ncbi:Pyridoxamine 5'-phosphate oxidase [bacterium A37T11]|nr:Pyridoxamine 5'-phosphate oxidase [bacterium A37T11]
MAEKYRLEDIRQEYLLKELTEEQADKDALGQFNKWLEEALISEIAEPTAMTLATATKNGTPSARIVLLKHADANGFQFYTNYDSRKGNELEQNPKAALLFFWPDLQRQVRIEGVVKKLNPSVSDHYFNSRPVGSRLGAIASPQSKIISGRKELEERLVQVKEEHTDKDIERPAYWGGYLLIPDYFEFWQGRENRLHDRITYILDGTGWVMNRLAP